MKITIKKQAENAIKFIDNLTNYTQAPEGERGVLGDDKDGYCCLGAACKILNIKYESTDSFSYELINKIGLFSDIGMFNFDNKRRVYNNIELNDWESLTNLNDFTDIGFKGIQKLMKNYPHLMYTKEIANIIELNYKN